MLILTRKIKQTIVIGDNEIRVHILSIDNGQVKVGIEAPRDVPVHRKEIYDAAKEGGNAL